MTVRAQAHLISGGRLHLHDGPIDLIVAADGAGTRTRAAYRAATARFASILDELCEELASLRTAISDGPVLRGSVAMRMARAVRPYGAETFITPMAAVAGSVAEEVLSAMLDAAGLDRAYVNNGGDIALHLGEGRTFRVGIVDRPDRPSLLGETLISHGDGILGIATSGWRGRSFSLGIADAVTVLARRASEADAAATVVANAVDLPGHPAVSREKASDIQPDSDLGTRFVTRNVGPLQREEIERALDRGAVKAANLIDRELIRSAALHLQGITRVVCASVRRKERAPARSQVERI